MPFFRTLLIILVIFIVFKAGQILYRSYQRRHTIMEQRGKQQISTPVVPCEICGIHIPKTEALAINGRYACNEAHGKDLSDRS